MSARGWLVIMSLFAPQLMKSFQPDRQSRLYAQLVAAAAKEDVFFEPSTASAQQSAPQNKKGRKKRGSRGKRSQGRRQAQEKQLIQLPQPSIDYPKAIHNEDINPDETSWPNEVTRTTDEAEADKLLHEIYEVVINHTKQLLEYPNNQPLPDPHPVALVYNPFCNSLVPVLPILPLSR